MTRDRVAGAGLLLVAGAVALAARGLPFGTLTNPGPGYWPLLLAAALALFSLVVIGLGGAAARLRRADWAASAKPLAILGAAAFIALALEPLGYRLTIAIAVVALLGLVERRRPLTVLATAALLAFGTHYLIAGLLKVPLPTGPWGF